MDIETLAGALLSAAFAVISVALWTLRVALTAAGRRLVGALVSGVEALTFVVAFGRIVTNLDNLYGIAGYAAGVAVGTMIGVIADERLSTGQSWVRVIVAGDGEGMAAALMRRRWPVTALSGSGPGGPVTELVIAVDDRYLPTLIEDLDDVDPTAFRAVERLRSSRGRPLPGGLRQVGDPRRAGAAQAGEAMARRQGSGTTLKTTPPSEMAYSSPS